jgi:FKBP-type peptidyl-prolyl cis-trans isomerase
MRAPRDRLRPGLGLVLLIAAAVSAGCGSSSSSSSASATTSASSSAVTVSSGEAQASATSSGEASSSTPTTPTSGPLSHEPKAAPASGPAPDKLVIKEIIKGSGAEAKSGDRVTVNYVGVLYNSGQVFDASWKRHEPFPFTLGQGEVIPGWEQGVEGMHVGGRRELIIPPALAYGASGRPPVIPPNATLVFVVDLLGA